MDPNITLRDLLRAVLNGETDDAQELADALDQWLRRGGFSPLPAVDASYQGWRNYETRTVHSFLTGTEEIAGLCRSLARVAITDAATCPAVGAGHWTIDEACRNLLSDRLKHLVDDRSPLVDAASVYSDLLGSALYKVDWLALADDYLKRGRR